MTIEYDHAKGLHTVSGPQAALPIIFTSGVPKSLLDVGCGTGTWLKAAQEFGVADVFGIDGVDVATDKLLISKKLFRQQDLTQPWRLGRKFVAALCLEVGEHLPASHAATLIHSLTIHSDTIFFSAAAPGQDGQNHVNCQWPEYWQKLFNECGYVCDDGVRRRIWSEEKIEPWYRQNLFMAHRNLERAGHEPRIQPVIHPANLEVMFNGTFKSTERPSRLKALCAKLRKKSR